jgi:hypothetical protein
MLSLEIELGPLNLKEIPQLLVTTTSLTLLSLLKKISQTSQEVRWLDHQHLNQTGLNKDL